MDVVSLVLGIGSLAAPVIVLGVVAVVVGRGRRVRTLPRVSPELQLHQHAVRSANGGFGAR